MKRILLLGFILTLILPITAGNANTFNAESFTLKNGLEVILIPNHRVPVVTHMIWYKVGAADELPGLSGMAHYLEHLMFKGTKKQKPGEFSKRVKELGGSDNAFTSQDYTAYFQSIPVQHLEEVMSREADRMVNLTPPPEHFASEKNVVIEERRQRTENDPRGLFFEQTRSALFINHPYGTPVIGWMNEIEKYEWEDVKKFYDKWYAPNNAILIVTGDITLKKLKPLVEKTYGKVKPKGLPERKRPEVPKATGDTLMTLEHKTILQDSFSQRFLAPAYHKNKKDALALSILQEIISSGPTTRLYKSLVVDQKKAISAGMSYTGQALDYGTISISARPINGTSLEEVENLLHAEIQNIIKNGVTKTEVSEAIQRLQDTAIFSRDSLSGPAMIFGYSISTGSTIDDIEYWTQNLEEITPKDVQRVTKKYLDINSPWVRTPVTAHLKPIQTNKKGNE